uniref:Uncharacterized protein LOC114347354 n=1 Tax=Diabrotica virgifera virgifera TaxID=50390 RepID=A0A6P7GWL7_DIAVI
MSDVNSKNNRAFTPLHEAVQAENVKMADWLIIESRNENFNDYEPYYNIISFSKYKRRVPFCMRPDISEDNRFLVDLVRMLLKAEANLNQQTVEERTPLHFAVQRGLTNVVGILLQKGASVTLTAQNLPARILLKAPIKVMVKNGLMFKVVNDGYVNLYSGNTVLHQAAESDITDIAKLILDKGADINAQNSRGKTALHIAADNAKYHMVEFLILSGANLSIKDNYGLVPLENIYTGPYELVTAATKNYYDGDDDDDEFDDESYLAYRRELLKYIVLWQYNQEYLFVKSK